MKCVECADYAECSKKHNLTIKRKHCPMAKIEYVQTHADRIRAMSDELLASQMVVVVEETIKALTGLDVPDEVLNEVRSQLLERLKQPAEETVYCKDCEHLMFSDCYGECSKAYKGIVHPDDTCEHGVRRKANGV